MAQTTTLDPSPSTQTTISLADRRRSLLSSTVGNVLEWYEWTAYSVMSPFIAAAMFDQNDPASAILSVFAVFAVGFLMRPIGGIFFGWLGDRIGRKAVLLTTMLMMAAACFLIGLMPTFAMVGVWASVFLLVLRCVQGFAHGGESTASITYIAEIAPNHRRGQWGSVTGVSIIGGSVLAFLVGALLNSVLGDEAMGEYGWRIPFFVAGVMALVVLWMRRKMSESDVFENATQAVEHPKVPRRRVIAMTVRIIALISGVTCFNYVWMTYMTTYAINEQGMGSSAAYWATVVGQLACVVVSPFLGRLSDRIGRKPMYILFAVLAIAVTVPFSLLVNDQPWTLTLTVGLALSIWALANSPLAAVQAESLPTYVRGRGIGFAYSLAVAVFGGTAPYLNQLFVSLEQPWLFNAYVMGLCGVTLIASFFFRETKGADLNKLEV
jgi:MHS family alpha-ketoglutarate permease-like MFS transporter